VVPDQTTTGSITSGYPLSPDIDLYIRAYRGAHTITMKKIKICNMAN
jgi:hypothetical protein